MQSEQELQELAKKRVQARTGFVSHLLLYVVVHAGLIAIWAFSGQGYPWFLWPLFCWGAAVAVHGVTLWIGPDSPREQRSIARELERLRLKSQPH